jgi:FLYWCH zinc finger domain
MAFEFGVTSKGKPTVILCNFEYVKERDNVCGTVSWRCKYNQKFGCKARLVTAGNRVVSNRQPDHNHSGNVASSLAQKAVADMKAKVTELTATPSSSQAAVMAPLDDHVLMALPKRALLSQTLRRYKSKVTSAETGGRPLPAIPGTHRFDFRNSGRICRHHTV